MKAQVDTIQKKKQKPTINEKYEKENPMQI
jgi:hypothetical protein